jgi:hypothetical protein
MERGTSNAGRRRDSAINITSDPCTGWTWSSNLFCFSPQYKARQRLGIHIQQPRSSDGFPTHGIQTRSATPIGQTKSPTDTQFRAACLVMNKKRVKQHEDEGRSVGQRIGRDSKNGKVGRMAIQHLKDQGLLDEDYTG